MKSILIFALSLFGLSASAQTIVLGNTTNDTVKTNFFSQQDNAGKIIRGLVLNAGTNKFSPTNLSQGDFLTTNKFIATNVAASVKTEIYTDSGGATKIVNSDGLSLTLDPQSEAAVFTSRVTGFEPTATNDFATKAYVDASGGSGTVTSVAATVPSEFSVSGSPITTSGTLAISKSTQSANTVWAGPISGAAAQPAFRLLNDLDIPSVLTNKHIYGLHTDELRADSGTVSNIFQVGSIIGSDANFNTLTCNTTGQFYRIFASDTIWANGFRSTNSPSSDTAATGPTNLFRLQEAKQFGTNATNFTVVVSNFALALGLNGTNFTLSTSNALYSFVTNLASGKVDESGGVLTNGSLYGIVDFRAGSSVNVDDDFVINDQTAAVTWNFKTTADDNTVPRFNQKIDTTNGLGFRSLTLTNPVASSNTILKIWALGLDDLPDDLSLVKYGGTDRSFSLGKNNTSGNDEESVTIGNGNINQSEDGHIFGENCVLTNAAKVAIGYIIRVTNSWSGGIGSQISFLGEQAWGIGNNLQSVGTNIYIFGKAITNSGNNAVIFGLNNTNKLVIGTNMAVLSNLNLTVTGTNMSGYFTGNGGGLTNLNSSIVTNGSNVTVTPATNATTGQITYTVASSGGGGGGSQTPWTSDINGGGYSLTNATNLSGGGTATTAVKVNGVKVYRALISQAGTNAPTATVLENTLGGTVVWTRSDVGDYAATLVGAFPSAKTWQSPRAASFVAAAVIYFQEFTRTSADAMRFYQYDNGEAAADGFDNIPVEILVYP